VLVNSQGYELLWYDVVNGSKVNASSTKDFEYATFTSLLGFPVQGIWPSPDYSDVNTTCRSYNQRFLATGEDSGLVKLFRYPCVTEGAKANEFHGHSSHVTKVKFTKDDVFCVSVGGNDKTLIFWETDFGAGSAPVQDEESSEDEPQQLDHDDDFEVSRVDRAKEEKQKAKEEMKQALKPQKTVADQGGDEDDMFAMEDVGEGDEFMAVKPWIGQMKEPTGFTKPQRGASQKPNVRMDLEWVHGYRAHDCKNNLTYLSDDSMVVYHAAGVGIVYDKSEHK